MKEQILSYFFDKPNSEINISELANKLKTNKMTIKRKVEELAKEELLNIKKKKLETIIRLNKDKSKTDKRLYNIKKILESGLIDYLEKKFEFPNAIILFGSYSFGEDIENSDIDIAIQTNLKKTINLNIFEKKLGKPIDLFILTEKTPENLKKSIYNGIVLKGIIQ